MACDKCDPLKVHRAKGVENTIIPGVAFQLQKNETYDTEIQNCKFCNQQFDVIKYNT